MKIVIADDHHVVRKGLRFFFATQDDIEVVGEAATGIEALRVIEETKPDLVLMDLSMPEMDGIQAIKKAIQQFPETNIIVLTSYSDQEHVIPALQAGAKAYSIKGYGARGIGENTKTSACWRIQAFYSYYAPCADTYEKSARPGKRKILSINKKGKRRSD